MSTTVFDYEKAEAGPVMVRSGKHGRWTPLASLAGQASWHVKHAAAVGGYHAARTPLYYVKVAQHAPRGLWEVTRGSWRWFTDSDGRKALRATFDKESESFVVSRRQHRDEIKARAFVSMCGLGVVGLGGAWGYFQLPDAIHPVLPYLAGGAVPLGLGFLGRPEGERAIERAELPPTTARIVPGDVVDALCAVLPSIARAVAKDPKTLRVIVGHEADGWHAEVALPAGVTADEVIERRDKLASALDRSVGMVHPKPHPSGRTNRLTIDITNKDSGDREQGSWPLAKATTIDVFRPFSFGEDALGNDVTLSLAETNVLIGSLPGKGKTNTIKTTLAGAILDPRLELQVFELKGTGDLRQFEPVCTRYAHGGDDDTLLKTLEALREMDKERVRRTDLIASLPFETCPESKVTSAVAEFDGLHPMVMVIDEVHRLILSQYGDEASQLIESIIKLGRALGITLIVATQRPSATSLPSEIRSQFGTRFCLQVKEQPENDMILGTGAYGSGLDATKLTQRGMGILDGQEHLGSAQTCRVYYLDAKQIARTVERALFLRGGVVDKHVTPAETVALEAVSEIPEEQLLRDILTVGEATPEQIEENPAREFCVRLDELAERLRDSAGDYADMTDELLRPRLFNIGIKTKQINRRKNGELVTVRGIPLAHVRCKLLEAQCDEKVCTHRGGQ